MIRISTPTQNILRLSKKKADIFIASVFSRADMTRWAVWRLMKMQIFLTKTTNRLKDFTVPVIW